MPLCVSDLLPQAYSGHAPALASAHLPFKSAEPAEVRVYIHGRMNEFTAMMDEQAEIIAEAKERDRTFLQRCDMFRPEVQNLRTTTGREREQAFWRIWNELAETSQERPFPNMHRKITMNFLTATLPKMYGAEFDGNISMLLKRYQIDHINTRVLVSMPRRHGKTETACAFLAALALAFAVQVNIYSISMETSKLVSTKILSYIHKAAGKEARFEANNVNKISVHPLYGNTEEVSIIRSYSSNEKIGSNFQEERTRPRVKSISIAFCGVVRIPSFSEDFYTRQKLLTMVLTSFQSFLAQFHFTVQP